MNTIRRAWWVLSLAVAMLTGCPDPDPTPYPGDTRQTCSQMGYRCGYDDYGSSCGNCGAGTSCNGSGFCASTSPTCVCSGAVCGNDSCGNPTCGTCTGGRTCSIGVCVATAPTPTIHSITSGSAPLFSNFYGVPFTVPASRAGYAASSPGDNFNVGIFTAADWAIYSNGGAGARSYAFRENVRTANELAEVPAGNYVLGFYCTNLIQRCAVTYAINAYY